MAVVVDHYQIMLLDCGAEPAEVKAQWRKLASELHPDRFIGMSAKVQLAATDRFAALSGAYAVLSDPKRKAAFDFERAIGRKSCIACKGAGRIVKRGLTAKTSAPCKKCLGEGLMPK